MVLWALRRCTRTWRQDLLHHLPGELPHPARFLPAPGRGALQLENDHDLHPLRAGQDGEGGKEPAWFLNRVESGSHPRSPSGTNAIGSGPT